MCAEDVESYITMEAAKVLRNKLGSGKHASSVEHKQQDDYDEILKEIILSMPKQQSPHHHQIFYEKKYFDYLPNEISDSDDVTSEDLSHELVKMFSEYISSEDEQQKEQQEQEQKQHMVNDDGAVRENSRRLKRDLLSVMQQGAADENKNSERNKRNSVYYIPYSHYSPMSNIHYFYPREPFFNGLFPSGAESRNDFRQVLPQSNQQFYPQQLPPQPQFETGNNPWTPQNSPHMRFHQANNFYLPPPQPSPTYLPGIQSQRPQDK